MSSHEPWPLSGLNGPFKSSTTCLTAPVGSARYSARLVGRRRECSPFDCASSRPPGFSHERSTRRFPRGSSTRSPRVVAPFVQRSSLCSAGECGHPNGRTDPNTRDVCAEALNPLGPRSQNSRQFCAGPIRRRSGWARPTHSWPQVADATSEGRARCYFVLRDRARVFAGRGFARLCPTAAFTIALSACSSSFSF